MTVRAKFSCYTVVDNPGMEGKVVTLYQVTSGSGENDRFYRWTPGGVIELSTVNDAAAGYFVPGKEYYVDFVAADE